MEPNIHRRKLIREFWIMFTMFVKQHLEIHNFHCGTFHSVRIYENGYIHLDTEKDNVDCAYAVYMSILNSNGTSITKLTVMACLSYLTYDTCVTLIYKDNEHTINLHPEKIPTKKLEEILNYMKEFSGHKYGSRYPLPTKHPVFI